jgi:L-alanine-DL-glutamate epimerase-like enolase superfamily enzyme
LHVYTDEGIEGRRITVASGAGWFDPQDVEQLHHLVVGRNPLDRELLYQMLHQGTRWLYRVPGWFGAFDNRLSDTAGKVANLPVYHLLGRARNSIPTYSTFEALRSKRLAKTPSVLFRKESPASRTISIILQTRTFDG